MSYAAAAAKGPKQNAEEARAPPVPEVVKSDDSVHSLVDVDSPHVSAVPSDFETQSVKTDTQAERIELEERSKQAAEETKARAKKAEAEAKAKARRGGHYAKENADNPVVIANALTIGLIGSVIGFGAYRKWTKNELTWNVIGAWAGVVGLFAVGDYYISQYFFKRYPPKK